MATSYVIKGIQSELQNVTSKNDAVVRHTSHENSNRTYKTNNCGIYNHIGNQLNCIISGTGVRVSTGMGCLYGRDFEVKANTVVEVDQNTSGFIVVVYDENIVDGTQRFYLTSISNNSSEFIQQDLLNTGKKFMMKLCSYVATAQVDKVTPFVNAKLNDNSLFTELDSISTNKADKTDLNKKVDKVITDSLNKYSNLGTRADGTPDLVVWSSLQPDSAYRYIGLRLVDALGNYHGFFFDENNGRLRAYLGTGTSSINIASLNDLADRTIFAIGNGTKRFAFGKNSGGDIDFDIWHDMEQENMGMRRITGNDKHGFYINEANGNLYIYTGNQSNSARLARGDELPLYVRKAIGDKTKSVTLGETTGGVSDLEVWHDMENQLLGTRRITGDDKHGFFVNEVTKRLNIYTGNKSDSSALANMNDLTPLVRKAIGNSTKTVTIGENTGGDADFVIWHDMTNENTGIRRSTGDDKHGWFVDETTGNAFIYTGNKSEVSRLARLDEVTTGYVKKATSGVSQKVILGDYNGGTTTPFYAHAYVNSSGLNSVKLINTFSKGEQGFYVHEGGAYHINNGTTMSLAYNSTLGDYVKKAVGDSSKTAILGTNTGGATDMVIFHDITNENMILRRLTGADYHGFYSNEDDQHMYVYIGNKAEARQIANSVDLLDYAKLTGATFKGSITGTSLNMSGSVTGASVIATGNVSADNVYANNGLVKATGNATGFVHQGVARTAAQDIILANDVNGKRRLLLRSDTDTSGTIYLTGYDSGGSTSNKGITMANDYVRHIAPSGSRALAHLDEIKATALDTTRMLSTQQTDIEILQAQIDSQQAQIDMMMNILAQDNPELLRVAKTSTKTTATSTTREEVDALINKIETELAEIQQADLQAYEELQKIENGGIE